MARVHHLDCGPLRPLLGPLFGGRGWRGRLVCHCLLVETERDGLVLVDTGFGAADLADPLRLSSAFRAAAGLDLTAEVPAIAQVRRLGYQPSDVRNIVVTHLDLDHAGGLVDFPAARVHVHRDEHTAAMARSDAKSRSRYLPNRWAHQPRWATYAEDGDTWLGIPAVRQLEGIRAEIALVPLRGHSRGHSAVAIRRGERWLVHAGDAYFDRRELTGGQAPLGLRWLAAIDQVDGEARVAAVAALAKLAVRHDVDVYCAHDAGELDRVQGPPRDP